MAALLDIVKKNSTDRSVAIRIIDSADGTPETGVVWNTSGIDLWYRREGAAKTSITEASLSALTDAHSDGGFLHVGDGEYRLDLPDAAVATGANYVDIGGTVTGMVVIGGRIRLVNYDPEDTVRLGLTALPNAAADAAGGLPISDAGGLDLDAQILTKINSILADTGTDGVVVNAAGLATDAVQEIRNAITGGAYALNTSAGGSVRVVDGTGTDEIDSLSGTVLLRAANEQVLADWVNGGRLDLLLDAIKAITDQFVFTVANQVDANAVAISGDATAANNLETMLDGTGGQTLTLKSLRLENTVDTNSALFISNSSGIPVQFYSGDNEAWRMTTNATDKQVILLMSASSTHSPIGFSTGSAIMPPSIVGGLQADSGTTTTLTDAGAAGYGTDRFKGDWLQIHSGTNQGARRIITAYDTTTGEFTFAPALANAIAADVYYSIIPAGRVDLHSILGTVSPATAGYVAPDWGQIANPTTTVNLSGTTVKTATDIATQIAALNNLSAAAAADAVWDEATSGHTTSGTFGEQCKTDIDAILDDTGTSGVVVNDLTAAALTELRTYLHGADVAGQFDGSGYHKLSDGTGTGQIGLTSGLIDGITGTIQTLDALDTAQDSQHSTTQAAIAALNNLSAAQVNAEVVDALATDTYAEPGQGAPAATATLAAKLNYLYKAWRNKSTQTATQYSLYNDDTTTIDQKSTVSDDGTTFTRGEVATGP